MEAGLYVVATPIGNLGDITLRALEMLKECDLILAEDTRHTRKLLTHFDFRTPLQSCHKFNEASRMKEFIDRIIQGQALVLVSDAGTPGVSDPGSRLVAACRDQNLPVFPIPGASSVTAAVSAAGLSSNAWIFGGFLPPKPGKRRKQLVQYLESELPFVLMVSPYKLLKFFEDMKEEAPERHIGAFKEITKKFEDFQKGTAQSHLDHIGEKTVRGEYVVVIYPPAKK